MLNKNFLIIFFGKFILAIISIISIKITTSLLSIEEMGSIYMFAVLLSFFVLLFISPMTQYFFRYINSWKEEGQLIDSVFLVSIYIFIIGVLSLIVSPIIFYMDILGSLEYKVFLILLFLTIVFQSFNQLIVPILNMLHYRISFTVLSILTAFSTILFGYLFIILLGNYAQNWLFGAIIANIIFGIIGFIVLKNKLKDSYHGFNWSLHRITKNKIKSILKFIIPLSIATLFMWIQNSGYRVIIEKNISLEFLGFFGVGMTISTQIASIVESIAMQYFHPIYYQEITNTTLDNRKKAINVLINKVMPIYFMLAVFLTFLAKYILEVLVSDKFYEAYIFTAFGIWIEFFRMTTNLFGNISQSEMNTKMFMFPYIIGSLLTVLLVYISSVGKNYQIYLPIALVISSLVTMLIMYFSMQRLISFNINYKLLLQALIISLPYGILYFIDLKSTLFTNLLVIILFGTYFLGTVFFIYKKGLLYDYS